MIYIDNNSTTPPLKTVSDAVLRAMRMKPWNPSSPHSLGSESRVLLETARDGVCSLLPGIFSEGITFTSGGTEGNNLVIGHHALDADRWTLITSKVEHSSILRPAEALARRGACVIFLDVSPSGTLEPDDVAEAVKKASGPVKVSIQWANSETGVIQPIAEIAAAVKAIRPDAVIHSDIAQAIGRVPIELVAAGVDVATFSGHKLHGPQGSGVMVLADPYERRLSSMILGGGQENGMRSGTQNVAAAAGLGVAAETRAKHLEPLAAKMATIRDSFERAVLKLAPEAVVNGGQVDRVPNTSNIRFRGIEGLALLAKLDERGVAASVGSACSSGKPSPSHVLTAMGLSEGEAYASVRFSFSVFNTQKQAYLAAKLVAECLRDLQ